MTETFLGVLIGMGIAWGLPILGFAAWIAAASCYRRAMRNRQRRAAAEQRAANVAKRIGMRWCPCCTRRSLRNNEVICPWCEAELVLTFESQEQS